MWNDLTMSERADVIKMAVKAGLRDMKSIRDFYDNSLKYADGGPKATYGKPYYSYDKNMQIETDNGKPILNYSATLPEVNIIPDSKKSPADRNEARRFREKVFSDNAEREARDYTQRQIMRSQRDWDNSLEKKALDYAQDAMTGAGIGADIVSGLPIYSSLKGARVLSEANSLPEYIEGGLWLAPIGGVVGKEVYNTGKNAWNTSKNTIKNTIGDIGKNSKTTPVDFNNLTPEQWTAAQEAAIARGDMVEAQRLRDLHFQIYAPDTKIRIPLWSSSEEAFNSFDLSHFGETDSGFFGYGHYLTPIEKYAATYHPINRRFYVNMENPYIGSNDQYFNRIQYVKDILAKRKENIMHNLRDGKLTRFSKKLGINENTSLEDAEHLVDKYIKDETVKWNNKYVKYADEFEGKDGVLSWRELQGIPNKQEGIYKEVIVPKGEQIKSADAVTYDDNGVRIPLGLRDNFKSKDIRYGIIPLIGGTALSTNKKAEGGSIHIAPSKRGTFTAAATKHGMGVQEFASKVLANKDNYSPAMVKKANFAKNASKWKHGLGGYLFEEGGPKNTNREYKSANSWSTSNLHNILTPVSTALMNFGKYGRFTDVWKGGTPEETYFLPKNIQRQEFLSRGYTEAPNDYGLVKKAVNNRNIPVYQTKADDISREKVIPISNINDKWFGKEEAELEHPGHYPTAVYYSPYTNEYYQKGWDLNDYGGGTGAYNNYPMFGKIKADIADAVGSPVVTTTGISRIGSLADMMKEEDTKNIAIDFLNSKGLVPMWLPTKELPILNMEGKPFYDLEGKPFTYTVNEFVPSLPEITITGKRRKKVK